MHNQKIKVTFLFLLSLLSFFFLFVANRQADELDFVQDITLKNYSTDVKLPSYDRNGTFSLEVTLKASRKITAIEAVYDVSGAKKTMLLSRQGSSDSYLYQSSVANMLDNEGFVIGEYHLEQLRLFNGTDQTPNQIIKVSDSYLFVNANFMIRQIVSSSLVKEIYLSSTKPEIGSLLNLKVKLDDQFRGNSITVKYPIATYADIFVHLPYNRQTGYNQGALKILDIFGLGDKVEKVVFPLQNILVDNSYNQIVINNLAAYPGNATFEIKANSSSPISSFNITPNKVMYGDVAQFSLSPRVKEDFSVIYVNFQFTNESTPRKVALYYNNLTQKYMGTLPINNKITPGVYHPTSIVFVSKDQSWSFDYHYPASLNRYNLTIAEDTQAPAAPKINRLGNIDTVITGTAEPKSTVIAYLGEDDTDDSNEIARGQADALGKFKIYTNQLNVGDVVRVYAIDTAENQSTPGKTTVIDNEPPTINGVKNQTLRVDEEFDPLEGITAFDPTDGDLTDQIKVTGSFKTSRVGNYRLTYTVKDSSGNRTVADRTIVIQPQLKTLMFDSQGGSYVESISVPAGTKVKAPTDPTRIGYSFAGWYTDEEYAKSYVFNQPVNDTITLYAKWMPLAPDTKNYVVMYRLYNPNSGEHLYSADLGERANLVKIGWKDEGVAWIAPTEGQDVYRLYNPNSGDHHYTLSSTERDYLVRIGWRYEGVGWKSDPEQRVPIYRVYNKFQKKAGSHHYTVSKDEQQQLVKIGWNAEGVGWYAIS